MTTTKDLARVARLHYDYGLTHQQIAKLVGCSRVKVTRMLAQAREQGIVQISINVSTGMFDYEEAELQRRFGLERVWVAPTREGLDETRESVAVAAARALEEIIQDRSIVAIALSSGLAATFRHLRPQHRNVRALPAGGGFSGVANGSSAPELSLEFARRMGGQATSLPAPIHVRSPELAASICAESGIKHVLSQVAMADVLLMGIGSASSGGGLMDSMLSLEEQLQVVRDGAVGNAAAHFFDAAGQPIRTAVADYLITADFDDLMKIEHRFAVASGVGRAQALHAAFLGHIATMCALDLDAARAVLAIE